MDFWESFYHVSIQQYFKNTFSLIYTNKQFKYNNITKVQVVSYTRNSHFIYFSNINDIHVLLSNVKKVIFQIKNVKLIDVDHLFHFPFSYHQSGRL